MTTTEPRPTQVTAIGTEEQVRQRLFRLASLEYAIDSLDDELKVAIESTAAHWRVVEMQKSRLRNQVPESTGKVVGWEDKDKDAKEKREKEVVPDANCVTTSDGGCVSVSSCMHGPGLAPLPYMRALDEAMEAAVPLALSPELEKVIVPIRARLARAEKRTDNLVQLLQAVQQVFDTRLWRI